MAPLHRNTIRKWRLGLHISLRKISHPPKGFLQGISLYALVFYFWKFTPTSMLVVAAITSGNCCNTGVIILESCPNDGLLAIICMICATKASSWKIGAKASTNWRAVSV